MSSSDLVQPNMISSQVRQPAISVLVTSHNYHTNKPTRFLMRMRHSKRNNKYIGRDILGIDYYAISCT